MEAESTGGGWALMDEPAYRGVKARYKSASRVMRCMSRSRGGAHSRNRIVATCPELARAARR
eukprot:2799249-Prymnesium_polylepis.1